VLHSSIQLLHCGWLSVMLHRTVLCGRLFSLRELADLGRSGGVHAIFKASNGDTIEFDARTGVSARRGL